MATDKKSPYRHKPNRGSMFDNERKEKPTQPDFTGTLDVNGTVYWLHGWKDTTQGGKRRISVSIQPQEERHPNQAQGDDGWGGEPSRVYGRVPDQQPAKKKSAW